MSGGVALIPGMIDWPYHDSEEAEWVRRAHPV